MENLQINKILVPIDYSETSMNALHVAIAMSNRHKAIINLLFVIEPRQYIAISSDALIFDFSQEDIIKEEIKRLGSLARRNSVTGTVECRIGDVPLNIIEAAHDFNADLIVMGTHGTSGIRAYFLGSDAYKVVKTAPCAVLTVPQNFTKTDFKEILFPVRPVEGALDKYDFTRKIIRKNDAHLTVFGVFQRDSRLETNLLTAMLDKLVVQLSQDEIKADIEWSNTVAWADAVLNRSQQFDIDLIVITSEIDTTIEHFFVGPFAQQIVNHAKVPVLSIRPQPFKAIQMQPVNDMMNTMATMPQPFLTDLSVN
ncbi:MAG: universal stress protein [Spirosomataceae bacterium]